MKIIFYRGDYPKSFNTQTFLAEAVGGTEFAAGYLALELGQNHEVYFICQTPAEKKIDNIRWIPLQNPEVHEIKKAFQKVGSADVLILAGGLSNLLESFEPKVKKIICWANGLSLKPNTILHLLQNRIHQVVCTSHYACQRVFHNTRRRLPLKVKAKYYLSQSWRKKFQKKFTFIYNGVNLDLFREEIFKRIPKKPFKILYAGVFNEHKNPDKILKVFPEIKKALPQTELHMCGSIEQYKPAAGDKTTGYFDGDEFFNQIKKYIYDQKGQIRDGLYLRGALPPAILAQEMMSASIVVVNPKVENQESSCIGALEAQAAGTPVIGGGYSALEETIWHQKTGFVFRHQEELAPLIIKILPRQILLQRIGQRGRQRAIEGFGWQTIAQEWEELMEAVLNNGIFIPEQH